MLLAWICTVPRKLAAVGDRTYSRALSRAVGRHRYGDVMGSGGYDIRVIEVDTAHGKGRDDLTPYLDPLVALAEARGKPEGIYIKSRDLEDADHPTRHKSYFIGICSPDSPSCLGLGQSRFRQVLEGCKEIHARHRKGPGAAFEILPSHKAYPRLVSDLGWADRL